MTIDANRLILGSAKIASFFRTAMFTIGREQHHWDLRGGGGLTSAFKPRLRLRQGLPLMLEMLPLVGGSLGVNMTPT